MPDIRQSSSHAEYLKSLGWDVKTIDGVYCYLRKIPILGTFIKVQHPSKLPIMQIINLAKKTRTFELCVEPINGQQAEKLIKNGFHLSKTNYLPTKTLVLDLTKKVEEIFGQFKKDARLLIKNNDKNSLIISNKVDIETFHSKWKDAVRGERWIMSSRDLSILKNAFKRNMALILDKEGNGGAIFLVANKTGYYWQAFTNDLGRKNHIQYLIVWEGIKWSKDKGAKIFDFEGIYDERFPKSSWKGFTHFKKSFGGEEIKYPGTFVKYLLPF